jgi:glucose-6-phosphate-specific signal transduction histidine kinase
MLEIYMDCLHGIWTWAKTLMLALAVLFPGIILLAYMFATNTPDVGWVPSILAIAAIILWLPVPLRHRFFKGKTWAECYFTLLEGIVVIALVCILMVLYLIWVGLPIMAGLTYCSLTGHEPAKWGIIGTGIATGVWAPGAHYLFMKTLDRVL